MTASVLTHTHYHPRGGAVTGNHQDPVESARAELELALQNRCIVEEVASRLDAHLQRDMFADNLLQALKDSIRPK